MIIESVSDHTSLPNLYIMVSSLIIRLNLFDVKKKLDN